MGKSVLDNPPGDLVLALIKSERGISTVMRKVVGSKNHRMGYRAFLNGFRPTRNELNSYEEIYKGYAKGWREARRTHGCCNECHKNMDYCLSYPECLK